MLPKQQAGKRWTQKGRLDEPDPLSAGRVPRVTEGSTRAAWHELLAPLPPDAVPRRQPVAPPEVLAGPHGWAIAGWEQVLLYLYAGPSGSRTVMAVLDGSGLLLSGSDGVVFRTGIGGAPPPEDCDAPVMLRMENVGGRFEPDGSFHGTRWLSTAMDDGREGDLEWESTPSAPTEADAVALQGLMVELMRRGGTKT